MDAIHRDSMRFCGEDIRQSLLEIQNSTQCGLSEPDLVMKAFSVKGPS